MTVNNQRQPSFSPMALLHEICPFGRQHISTLYSEAVILTTEIGHGYLVTLVHSNQNNLDNVYIL